MTPAKPPAPTPTRPVFARHAASLLVVRETQAGPEVLMGIRGPGHRFLPNRLVFPGGAVDPADAEAPVAAEPSPALTAMLQRRARPRLARAIAVAAARELHEEAGVSLGSPPRLDRLDYLCRAITPRPPPSGSTPASFSHPNPPSSATPPTRMNCTKSASAPSAR